MELGLTRKTGGEREPSAIGDDALIARARAGESWAIEALLRRYMKDVGRTVTHLLGSHEDVEDVVQETLLAALSGLSTLRQPSAFRGWLLRIAVIKSRRHLRSERRRVLGLLRYPAGVLEELADESVRPEVRAELAVLDQVLSRMPTEQRIVWILRHVEGHTVRDVSRLCQSSLATTKRRLARAQKRIAKLVDEEVLFNDR